jgi:hypothetical protein
MRHQTEAKYKRHQRIFLFYLLEDAINVDKRRAEVGLGKLQDYISNWE